MLKRKQEEMAFKLWKKEQKNLSHRPECNRTIYVSEEKWFGICKESKHRGVNPWNRKPEPLPDRPENDMAISVEMQKKFRVYSANWHLDIYTKMATLKASAFVVSLVSYIGKDQLFQSSGIIIESNNISAIVLTSAYLLSCAAGRNSVADKIKVVVNLSDEESFHGKVVACDFHYNLAAIKIKQNRLLPTAHLSYLNDSFVCDPSHQKLFKLRPRSNSLNLVPGDSVIALGRYFVKPYDIMAAPGEFCLDRCYFDCKELSMVTCETTRCGIGGPLINLNGDVVGICFYDVRGTPFLPTNIALLWWEHYKKYRELRRPWLGIRATNLCTASLERLQTIIPKFTNILEGVIVEQVTPGSAAKTAGLKSNDVIIQLDGEKIKSFLGLFKQMWDKVGQKVELVVLRRSKSLYLSMMVDEATSDQLYSWPDWENVE